MEQKKLCCLISFWKGKNTALDFNEVTDDQRFTERATRGSRETLLTSFSHSQNRPETPVCRRPLSPAGPVAETRQWWKHQVASPRACGECCHTFHACPCCRTGAKERKDKEKKTWRSLSVLMWNPELQLDLIEVSKYLRPKLTRPYSISYSTDPRHHQSTVLSYGCFLRTSGARYWWRGGQIHCQKVPF